MKHKNKRINKNGKHIQCDKMKNKHCRKTENERAKHTAGDLGGEGGREYDQNTIHEIVKG